MMPVSCMMPVSSIIVSDADSAVAIMSYRSIILLYFFLGSLQGMTGAERTSSNALLHYWDGVNFSDSLQVMSSDTLFMRWTKKLAVEDSSTVRQAVAQFTGKAYHYGFSRLFFTDMAEHTLFNLNSSQHNDRLYIVFLEATLSSPYLDEDEKYRYRFQLENIRKNLPGSTATDFIYLDRHRHRKKMSEIQTEFLVLFFYNPDCEHCRRTEAYLESQPDLQRPEVKILAVYPGFQTEEWQSSVSTLPSGWLDVCSPGGEINNRLLYFIQSTPSIYLLDRHKKVLLKEAAPELLVSTLKRLLSAKE